MPELTPALYRAGEGEPLVLVHGFTATWRCWLPVLAELVPRFEVIAPTLHGHHGGPGLPREQHARSTVEAADHLEQQLDELGVGEAHLVGNSLGGALVLELAKRGRAQSVVAISPGGGWPEEDEAEGLRLVKWFTRNQKLARTSAPYAARLMRRPLARKLALREVMAHGDQVPPGEAVMLVESSIECSVVEAVFETIRNGTALLTDLDKIEAPVLVAWGDKDRILPLPKHGPRFRDEIPGVEFRVMKGLGHTPMWDDPGLIAKTIADFAAAHSRSPVASA